MAVADPIRQHRSSPATPYQWQADRPTEPAACWRVARQLPLSTPEPNSLAALTRSLNSLPPPESIQVMFDRSDAQQSVGEQGA